jgi:hypothetical protein
LSSCGIRAHASLCEDEQGVGRIRATRQFRRLSTRDALASISRARARSLLIRNLVFTIVVPGAGAVGMPLALSRNRTFARSPRGTGVEVDDEPVHAQWQSLCSPRDLEHVARVSCGDGVVRDAVQGSDDPAHHSAMRQ